MINELYALTTALDSANIRPQSWHRKLLPLPNVTAKAPCVRVLLRQDGAAELSAISKENAANLRRYGDNQGLFPSTNLVPLYRIVDLDQKKLLQRVFQGKEDAPAAETLRTWCIQDNWNPKFLKKYQVSMEKRPAELEKLLAPVQPEAAILRFIREAKPLLAPERLRGSLESAAFHLLEARTDTVLALQVLFYLGDEKKEPEQDNGTLSVVLDSEAMKDDGMPLVSAEFLADFNRALLQVEAQDASPLTGEVDAFGLPFTPLNEPMPKVKLGGGFDASLRTMFKEVPCQYRYGQIEGDAYLLSKEMRSKLRDALEWISSPKHREVTWTSLSPNDILFAYPSRLPKVPGSFVKLLRRTTDQTTAFEQEARDFLALFHPRGKHFPENHTDRIQIFVIHKVDKGRSKVVYAHNTTPAHIFRQSQLWAEGCRSHPDLSGLQPPVLYPIQAAEVLNWLWKQDGTLAADKFRPIPLYRGIELFFCSEELTVAALRLLVQNTTPVAPYAGKVLAVSRGKKEALPFRFLGQLSQIAALFSLLLFQCGIRKETYMEQLPYLYGQLLKLSDELHVLYCLVERKGAVPPQLAGNGFYAAAQDAPKRTLGQLGLRMDPYLNWAKFYRHKGVQVEKKESWRAGWLLSLFEKTADKLKEKPLPARFNEEEKAQFFLGYLASFPKRPETDADGSDDIQTGNEGGKPA